MPDSSLDLTVRPQQLTYRPEAEPPTFSTSVTNRSDRFASFQIGLNAMGIQNPVGEWYRVEPEVSAKIPPGDRAYFQVVLVGERLQEQLALEQETNAAAVGIVDLEVSAIALELDGSEARERLHLAIEPSQKPIPLHLKLLQHELRGKPQERLEIRVEVENPSYTRPARARLELLGLSSDWLPDGRQQTLLLAPRSQAEVTFICQLPEAPEAVIAGIHPFTIGATHPGGGPSTVEGSLEILLVNGNLGFLCPKTPIEIPARRPWLPRRKPVANAAEIELKNPSNAIAPLRVRPVEPLPPESHYRLEFTPAPPEITLTPSSSERLTLTIHAEKRRWWRRQTFAVSLAAETLENEAISWHEEKDIRVLVHPKIPFWLTFLGAISLLGLGYYLSWLNPYSPLYYHYRSINSVEFNGRGTDFISGSNDTQVIEWDLEGFRRIFTRPDRQAIATAGSPSRNRYRQARPNIGRNTEGKAVQVARYRPRDNDKAAVGLENGVIQIWDLRATSDRAAPERTLSYDRADRVFDLQFAPDSQTLYSAHGRGALLEWRLGATGKDRVPFAASLPSCPEDSRENARRLDRSLQQTPDIVRARQMDFAIYSLAWVGASQQILAVAGEKNRLVLTDLTLTRCQLVPYGEGGTRDDYITALATGRAGRANLLASADNQGTIKIWRLQIDRNTADAPVKVVLVDRWQASQPNSPSPAIRSIALSADACFLISGGDDGRLMLWPLDASGKRIVPDGLHWVPYWWSDRLRKVSIGALDIERVGDFLLAIAATNESQVRFFSHDLSKDPDWQCP